MPDAAEYLEATGPNLLLVSKLLHRFNVKQGFYENRTVGESIALMHSELSELLEAHRRDPLARCDKEGVNLSAEEEEVADVFLRLLDFCGWRGIDLAHVAYLKHGYNLGRPHKHGKKL